MGLGKLGGVLLGPAAAIPGVGDLVDTFTGKAGAEAAGQAAQQLTAAGEKAMGRIEQGMAPMSATLQRSLPALMDFVLDPNAQAGFLQNNPILSQLQSAIQTSVFPSIEARRAAGGKSVSGGTLAELQNAMAIPMLSTAGDLLRQRSGELFGLTGMGQQAKQTEALSIADIIQGIGSAQAAGTMGAAQARAGSPLMQMIGTGGGMALGNMLSDARTKDNIVEIDRLDDGIGVYMYNYIDDDDVYVGVLAQEVQEVYPEAIREDDGVLFVNYDALGIDWRKYAS